MTSRIDGSVRVVGAGLLGASIGLALSKLGNYVIMADQSPAVQSLAIDYGAGHAPSENDAPALIVVCVPPDITAQIVARELAAYPAATVTDVASVKSGILSELRNLDADLSRYVGSHPMAGRERGGAASARADLFQGRVWVVSPANESSTSAVMNVENLALELGSAPVRVAAKEHDRAVAVVSHVPQIVASLAASTLVNAAEEDVALAGQGIRDTTRIAASDPKLWLQILSANATEITSVLKEFETRLVTLIGALENVAAPGSLAKISDSLALGNQGVARLPGKHGKKATDYEVVTVMIDDKPGELARLLTEIGEIGVNLEEIQLEHSPSSAVGLVEVSVLPAVAQTLITSLNERNWKLVG